MAPSLEDLASRQQDLLSRIANSLDNLKKRGKAALTSGNVQTRIQLLEGHWAKFGSYHEQILSLGAEVTRTSAYMLNDVYGQAEETYASQKGALLDLLNELQMRTTTVSDSAAARPEARSRPSLPRINLPQFTGRYDEWISFRDLFSSLIVKEAALSDVERLHYLKTSLSGEAAALLRNLPTTGANFERAWEILQTRYENRRLLVGAQISALTAVAAMSRESSSELKRVLDTTCDAIAALQTLDCPITDGTYWLVHLTANRLDARSRRDWETSLQDQTQPPTFDQLREFMENRVRALESIAQAQPAPSVTSPPRSRPFEPRGAKTHHASAGDRAAGRCSLCQRNHYVLFCSSYQAKTPGQRKAFVDSTGLCLNCLGKHRLKECRSTKTCQRCSLKHHSSLHEAFSSSPPASTSTTPTKVDAGSRPASGSSLSPAASTSHVAHAHCQLAKAVLLATARVLVSGMDGATSMVRALVDPCSEVSLVSEALVQRLRLTRRSASLPVIGVGSGPSATTRGMVSCVVISRLCDSHRLRVDAFVLPRLSAYRPRCSTPSPTWSHLEGLSLADPDFMSSEPIDLLLGADVYPALLLPGVRGGTLASPAAQETIFGWILSGNTCPDVAGPSEVTVHQCSVDLLLCQQVQRFWEQEEVTSLTVPLTTEERFCEAHYLATHSRQPDGRYVVALPLKQSPDSLGESRRAAVRTLQSMERRFVRDPSFGDRYRQFLAEYADLGHMVPCRGDASLQRPVYYLPHHGVQKDDGKIRVVFNGSHPTSTGVSLNDIQHVGPKLLQDLSVLLLRWRVHVCVVVADIEKMYRQVRVRQDDWDLQRIVWRSSPEHEMCEYHLTTVTYGQACAPFLAIRTLQQLATDEGSRFPLGAQALSSDVYVDDILSGAPTIVETTRLAKELLDLCMAGGFPLRKWASNSPEVLSSLPGRVVESVPLEWPELGGRSVLGLEWRPARDDFVYRIQPVTEAGVATKRRVLSLASRLFDPLGWLSPVTIRAKIFLQSLWLLKIDWDDPLPNKELMFWSAFQEDLASIREVTVPRWLGQRPSSSIEILGFSDASERAYAAAVYLRCQGAEREASVRLVAAKTKVAPIKSMALPRLELCGAVLLVRLVKFVRDTLTLPEEPARLFTDSTVVLGWIRAHPSRWKTFVANRVSEIQTSEPTARWGHVSSNDNPADCASRGIEAARLARHSLWWHGPPWVVSDGPGIAPCDDLDSTALCVEEKCSSHATTIKTEPEDSMLLRFSSLHRLLRVSAWCLRWRHRQPSSHGVPAPLLAEELRSAQVRWIISVQSHHFSAERSALISGKSIPTKSPLLRLNPFLDEEGQLRVGGRLKNAVLSFDEVHPVILPRESHLAYLIVEAIHRRTLHGGVQLTLVTLRRSFWVIQGRRMVKAVIHRCLTCIRWKASSPHQLMAPLPAPRVRPSRPFLHAGVDYAGPVFLRTAPGRGHKAYKGYISVFVCMATRAVHLEAVSAYSAAAFLAAYRRFAARRGLSAVLYSDCGTTFTGADAELRALFRTASSASREIATVLANDGTTWRFNPPAAPHFGGLWEAAVKSTKHHLRRVIGETTLTYEEMSTLLAQIEACLNSRPLQPLTDDPDDLAALTPAHFLVGSTLTVVPEPSLEDVALPRLTRWQLLQQMLHSFWGRWSAEYLSSLQGRSKWPQDQANMCLGQLCLLRQELLPPCKWPLARFTGIHPGADGRVRVVTVRTATSPSLTRPIAKIVPLPF